MPALCHGIKDTKSVKNIKEEIGSLSHVLITSLPAVLSHWAAGRRKPGLESSRYGDCQMGSVEGREARGSQGPSLGWEIMRSCINQRFPRSRRTDRVGEEKDGWNMEGVRNLISCFTFPSICKGPRLVTGVGPLSQVALKVVGFRDSKEAREFD